jgi:hypothetical protein
MTRESLTAKPKRKGENFENGISASSSRVNPARDELELTVPTRIHVRAVITAFTNVSQCRRLSIEQALFTFLTLTVIQIADITC